MECAQLEYDFVDHIDAKIDQPEISRVDFAMLKKQLASYRGGDLVLSVSQLLLTSCTFVLFLYIALENYYYSFSVSMIFSVLAAACLLRLFMIQHDCGHASYFSSKKANDWVGRIIGVISFTPYQCWRRYHATHHASTGNLDKRGVGDIKTLTVTEYENLSKREKLIYRIYRNPVMLFVVGPVYLFFIRQRLTNYIPNNWKREKNSVHLTNAGMLLFTLVMGAVFGFEPFLVIYSITMAVASIVGVWLFYVQHQFEEAYWATQENWDHGNASIHGSSYYALPAWTQWLVAHITVHHVHHLDCTIPNYKLKSCNENIAGLKNAAPQLSFLESLMCVQYKLWDEKNNRMVSF